VSIPRFRGRFLDSAVDSSIPCHVFLQRRLDSELAREEERGAEETRPPAALGLAMRALPKLLAQAQEHAEDEEARP
jgi:hypothetical protein